MASNQSSPAKKSSVGSDKAASSNTSMSIAGDTDSNASLPVPPAPPNTRAQTIASEVPDPKEITVELDKTISFSSMPRVSIGSAAESTDVSILTYQTDATENTMEVNNWASVAEEDVMKGLQRMAMLARDKHDANPEKSVQDYYSEDLAKLLKAGEIQFKKEFLD